VGNEYRGEIVARDGCHLDVHGRHRHVPDVTGQTRPELREGGAFHADFFGRMLRIAARTLLRHRVADVRQCMREAELLDDYQQQGEERADAASESSGADHERDDEE
jgi:hypothetical protein